MACAGATNPSMVNRLCTRRVFRDECPLHAGGTGTPPSASLATARKRGAAARELRSLAPVAAAIGDAQALGMHEGKGAALLREHALLVRKGFAMHLAEAEEASV